MGNVEVLDLCAVEFDAAIAGVERGYVDNVVGNKHGGSGCGFHLTQVDYGAVGLWCHIEDIARNLERLVVFIAQLYVENAHADFGLSIGIDADGVVADFCAQFIHHVDGLCAVVLEGVALHNCAHLLGQPHIARTANAHTDVASLNKVVPNSDEVVVAVGLVDWGHVDDVDALLRIGAGGGVQVAALDGYVAAFVLHHNHARIGVVGGGYLHVA